MPQPSDDERDDIPGAGSVNPADHPPIAFPDEDWVWFLARCEALAIPGAKTKREALEAVYGHLVGVNRWLNLTRLTAPREYLKNHLLDSLAVVSDVRFKRLAEGAWCADLGSGGGYPGIPLALWHPRVPWALLDARRRKAEFLAAALKAADLRRCRALHLRGADVARDAGASELHRRCQLVTSRAMGQAAEVLEQAAPLLRRHGNLVIWKGPAFAGDEREAAIAICPRLGFRHVSDRTVVLEPGDPERVVAVFERTT